MKIENVLNKLIDTKIISKKEVKELAKLIDGSKDKNLIIAFQVLCTNVFEINFSAMNTTAILEELESLNKIKIER